MAHRRFTIDIAIPETLPAALTQKPTPAQLTALANMTWIEIIQEMIRRLKVSSERVTPTEDTTRAKTHICRHADGQPCGEETDI